MQVAACLDLGRLLAGDPSTEFRRVVYDSRQVTPGSLFVAVPGFRQDGHQFIDEAVAAGAVAVVVEHPVHVPPAVAVLQVPSSRRALSALAARFFDYPSRRLQVVGVTGTNGKTTTTHLIRAILQLHGRSVGLIGTVRNYVGQRSLPVTHTTPEGPDLQELLYQMVTEGDQVAVMEVSSHALTLDRVADVEFDVAVFTNLTQDHLDFHQSLDEYRDAKGRLFTMLGCDPHKTGPKVAVLNSDDPASAEYRNRCRVPVVTYGVRDPQSMVRAENPVGDAGGTDIRLVTPWGERQVHLGLAGRFNVYNSLAAAAACLQMGVPLDTVARALADMRGVPGRLEPVVEGQPFGVFVDYAHTPDGLANVLAAARELTHGRVIAVFGAGGDRDRTKRPKMGEIAGRLADLSIITSDNPRTEEPAQIITDIEQGIATVAPGRYELVEDRTAAIDRALELARPGDVVIIAGKGHETYQIFRDRTIPYDDREVARSRLRRMLGAS
jgi:UDP-N-acetylmuramoyl-L-alanyl-D-glutamate--2,6-diaminopimelate ligase